MMHDPLRGPVEQALESGPTGRGRSPQRWLCALSSSPKRPPSFVQASAFVELVGCTRGRGLRREPPLSRL